MKTTLTVDDDGVLTFSNELLKATGWKEGDVLEWIDNKDGSFSLVKPDALTSEKAKAAQIFKSIRDKAAYDPTYKEMRKEWRSNE